MLKTFWTVLGVFNCVFCWELNMARQCSRQCCVGIFTYCWVCCYGWCNAQCSAQQVVLVCGSEAVLTQTLVLLFLPGIWWLFAFQSYLSLSLCTCTLWHVQVHTHWHSETHECYSCIQSVCIWSAEVSSMAGECCFRAVESEEPLFIYNSMMHEKK